MLNILSVDISSISDQELDKLNTLDTVDEASASKMISQVNVGSCSHQRSYDGHVAESIVGKKVVVVWNSFNVGSPCVKARSDNVAHRSDRG